MAASGIHIDPANRGKFTASAKAAGESVQKHAAKTAHNPRASKKQRQRAQFALNAKKWRKGGRKSKRK